MGLRASVWDDGANFCVQTEYNVVLVRLLNKLPELERVYRDETQTWYISKKHETMVTSWLNELGYLITRVDVDMPGPPDETFAVLGLLPTAIWEVCEAAYRALCKINHPDMGGNEETMKQINAAWDRVRIAKGKV
jgi:hypothetical protein